MKQIILSILLSLVLVGSGAFSADAKVNGIDTAECNKKARCHVCVGCCTTTSVSDVTQDEFNTYRKDFIMDSFYTNTVKPSLENLADDLRNAFLFKTAAIGAFLDGKDGRCVAHAA